MGNLELVRNGQLFFLATHTLFFTFASIINLLNKNNMKKIAVYVEALATDVNNDQPIVKFYYG